MYLFSFEEKKGNFLTVHLTLYTVGILYYPYIFLNLYLMLHFVIYVTIHNIKNQQTLNCGKALSQIIGILYKLSHIDQNFKNWGIGLYNFHYGNVNFDQRKF